MNFDIESLEATASATYRLVIGKDGDTEAGFVLLGPNSPEYIAIDRKFQIDRVQVANRKQGIPDVSTDAGAAVVVDKGTEQRDALIMACTVDWFGFKVGAEAAPFNPENLKRLLTARPTWKERIARAIETEANFSGA